MPFVERAFGEPYHTAHGEALKGDQRTSPHRPIPTALSNRRAREFPSTINRGCRLRVLLAIPPVVVPFSARYKRARCVSHSFRGA